MIRRPSPFILPAFRVLALLVALASTSPAAGPVLLSEVLASNQGAVVVGTALPDFVELHNPTTSSVALTGATLTDGSATSTPFVFPAGSQLGPGARLVVWCDRDLPLPAPHALFGLGATGDRLRLTGPEGTLWDELAFGLQVADLALARLPEGSANGTWQLALPTPGEANRAQATAPPDALFLNEWMASPRTGDDWIEVFNAASLPVELGGLVLTDSLSQPPPNRAVPALSFIAAHGHVQFFASDLRQPDADHLDFRLSASAETVSLMARDRVTLLDRVTYGPQAADVAQGRTPDGGEIVTPFPPGQSTPGSSNLRPITEVVISEALSHTDPPLEDAIELRNLTDTAVDLSHWWLSDSAANPRKYRIPAGTVVPANGFRVFYEYQFGSGPNGFSLNSYEGDDVWLSAGDAGGNLTGRATFATFGALKNGVSIGRVETSTGADFAPLARRTFGQDLPVSTGQFRQGTGLPNAEALAPRVRLAEIRLPHRAGAAAPASTPYLELHNAGTGAVSLYDPAFPTNTWRLRGTVTFEFPPGLQLAPDARLLITSLDPAGQAGAVEEFRRLAAVPGEVILLGPWKGTFPSSGPFQLELQEPDAPEGPTKPRPGFVPYVRLDRLDYSGASPWPVPDPGTADTAVLLRRATPPAHGNDPAAWQSGPASPGRAQPAEPDPDADADGDGLPDDWERLHGFNPEDADDALLDADGDGASNLEEFVADTHPRDAADRFVLTAHWEGARGLRLSFHAAANRAFALESRLQQPSTSWQVLTSFPVAPDASRRELTVPTWVDAELFRLRVLVPP